MLELGKVALSKVFREMFECVFMMSGVVLVCVRVHAQKSLCVRVCEKRLSYRFALVWVHSVPVAVSRIQR